MKKTISKKIIGGTLIVAFLATLGAVLVAAETDDITDNDNTYQGFECGRYKGWHHPYYSELTEEQQEEINDLRQQLIEENATFAEIWEAINEKLAEFGIELPDKDEILDEQIEQTTLQLEILELQKQLREDGKSWEEIEDILEEEYDISSLQGHHGMKGVRGGHKMYDNSEDDNSIDDTEDSEI